jgi:hypothetical protein
MNRPSHKELSGRLRSARQAIEEGRVALLNDLALAIDAIELGYSIEMELIAVLIELIEATTPAHYTGSRPPQRSYEQDIKGLELFAFTVDSRRLKRRIYYKFALSGDIFWLVSLHQDRPMKEEL